MGIPVYWSHVQASTASAALKPTLKQTRPTPGSIRRQPHIRRRPTYSEIARGHGNGNGNVSESSFIPQRVLPTSWSPEPTEVHGFQNSDALSEMNQDQNAVHSFNRNESNREEDGGRTDEAGRGMSLQEFRNSRVMVGPGNRRREGIRETMAEEVPDDETTQEDDDNDTPDSRHALRRARAIPPGTFMNDRDLQVLARETSGGTWDISQYFPWMSNPSDSLFPMSIDAILDPTRPGVHTPEPIPLVEPGYESTSEEDSESDPEMHEGLRRVSGISQGLRAEEAVRRQRMGEEDWPRREPEGLERWRQVMRTLHRQRSIRNGSEIAEEEEEEILPDDFGGRYPWE